MKGFVRHSSQPAMMGDFREKVRSQSRKVVEGRCYYLLGML